MSPSDRVVVLVIGFLVTRAVVSIVRETWRQIQLHQTDRPRPISRAEEAAKRIAAHRRRFARARVRHALRDTTKGSGGGH